MDKQQNHYKKYLEKDRLYYEENKERLQKMARDQNKTC